MARTRYDIVPTWTVFLKKILTALYFKEAGGRSKILGCTSTTNYITNRHIQAREWWGRSQSKISDIQYSLKPQTHLLLDIETIVFTLQWMTIWSSGGKCLISKILWVNKDRLLFSTDTWEVQLREFNMKLDGSVILHWHWDKWHIKFHFLVVLL